jgi:hypothetical protein
VRAHFFKLATLVPSGLSMRTIVKLLLRWVSKKIRY